MRINLFFFAAIVPLIFPNPVVAEERSRIETPSFFEISTTATIILGNGLAGGAVGSILKDRRAFRRLEHSLAEARKKESKKLSRIQKQLDARIAQRKARGRIAVFGISASAAAIGAKYLTGAEVSVIESSDFSAKREPAQEQNAPPAPELIAEDAR